MGKVAALAVLGFGVGFLAGFLWGQGTRRELPGATSTGFSGGKLTVTVDARQALENGLSALLGS